jgi:ribosomal protein S18 acetylase RimI-like enzyme
MHVANNFEGVVSLSQNVIVRQATNQDILELYKLITEYIVDFYKQPMPDESELKGLIQHLLENPSVGLQFVAEFDGQLVGFATLYFTFSTLRVKKQAILNDLYVKSDIRGKRVGEKLFQACLHYIRENDFCSMTWETAKDNKVAQSLYNKMGGEISPWLFYEIS